MIHDLIEKLLLYGLQRKLFLPEDKMYIHNRLLHFLGLQAPEETQVTAEDDLEKILTPLLDWAYNKGLFGPNTTTHRDLFDTALMDLMLARPSDVSHTFFSQYQQYDPSYATKAFYQFNKDAHYIRVDRIALNESWDVETPYGPLEITINLSKPEKDPEALAEARKQKTKNLYPSGPLAKENIGYAGSLTQSARQTLRFIPLSLAGEQWYFQFSPYVYYNEHAIVFSGEQQPMKISEKTFMRLFDFIDQFPHYFIGSNADLPIVGGSILEHDHYQGGVYDFPMAQAPLKQDLLPFGNESIRAGIVDWPMSVIRLTGKDRQALITTSTHILTEWRSYTDPQAELYAFSNEEPHNTVTPVLRMKEGNYELDLVLRNNRTTKDHPLGLFHPHQETHAIKKENIGLIEVMGLAILPGRLKQELEEISKYLLSEHAEQLLSTSPYTEKHTHWALKLKNRLGQDLKEENVMGELKKEVGTIFSSVLEHAGIFKDSSEGEKGFLRFWAHCQESWSK
ncbi:UDP-glucose--hexose-1-phosphate uridylyltransferase [Shouchella hunanensis]|uniref:Galactose-1-phosphate uridylyltransferase n=1 Tax=Shouchella hunanensis TaxID=766894 RepID=A0ABY7W0J2_9BACI|nr:UDP-glucose--hexose-1-phosphate uridylyltransferase [Shouchella hunanensis]WDF02482.1 UDP-glucose--hexose-1-phosphate uridylyltransferase [Shouchella hunanensis]